MYFVIYKVDGLAVFLLFVCFYSKNKTVFFLTLQFIICINLFFSKTVV